MHYAIHTLLQGHANVVGPSMDCAYKCSWNKRAWPFKRETAAMEDSLAFREGGGEGSETNLVPLLRGVAGLLVKGGLGPICHMVEAGTSFQFMELLMDGKRNYGTVVIPPYSFQVVGINNCTCPLLYLNWYCLWCVCFIFGLCQLII